MDACPRCGAEAVYVGLRHVECATSGCPNHRAPASKEEPGVASESAEPVTVDGDPNELPYELWLEAYGFF